MGGVWGVPGGNTLTPREEERGKGVDDVAVTWQEFFRHRVLVSGGFSRVFCSLCGRTGPAIPPRRGGGVFFVCCDGHGQVGRGTGGVARGTVRKCGQSWSGRSLTSQRVEGGRL